MKQLNAHLPVMDFPSQAINLSGQKMEFSETASTNCDDLVVIVSQLGIACVSNCIPLLGSGLC